MSSNAISLYELNSRIKGVIRNSLSDTYWLRAEMSDVRVNQSSGHCYLEFIEKDNSGRNIVAKARAVIWANTFHLLKAYFENSTKQPFISGLKVLVSVSVEFHELYGFSLVVHDIDPSYTLGDQAMNRAAILKQLADDGVLTMNKELNLSVPANRIAVISSPTAAGYEDFCDQLFNNEYGLAFYIKLFPAIMQGDRAESSIISALEKIYDNIDNFDIVVIIRGGGATSELSCFDSYLLAASVAQFPLPIVTGIGHERDETVLDIVAYQRAKTPTAVAEYLISIGYSELIELENLRFSLITSTNQLMQEEALKIQNIEARTSFALKSWQKEQELRLEALKINLKRNVLLGMKDETNNITSLEKHLELLSPENIMKKGYSLTLMNGKVIKHVSQMKAGDLITTRFIDGEIESVVKKQH